MSRLISWEAAARSAAGTEQLEVRAFAETGSTMDDARSLIREVAPASLLLVLAERQNQGRGRQGRRWESASGNLFATVAFRLERADPAIASFSLIAGLVVLRALEELGVTSLRCKWPNDIVGIDRRKLAGILLELVTDGAPWVLVGVGVNMLYAPLPDAVALRELTSDGIDPATLSGRLAARLFAALQLFEAQGFAAFHADCVKMSANVGHGIEVDLGDRILKGTCTGLSERGGLLVKSGEISQEILAGHVLRWGMA